MIAFKSFLKNPVSESIIDPMHKTLDKSIFLNPEDENQKINPLISAQIESDIEKFEQIVPVSDYYLVGSILSKHYNERSDLDITVEINKNAVDDEKTNRLYDLCDELNGRPANNSTHPINYHLNFVDAEEDLSDNFDNIYNLKSDTWEKRTEDKYIDPQDFMEEFDEKIKSIDLNTMEIRRDIIDLDELKEFSRDDIEGLVDMVNDKLSDIEDNIREMSAISDEMHDDRRDAFKNVTPEKLKELGTKNALPENIIYKLMERYYYFELIEELEKILEKDDEIDKSDVPDIKKALNDFNDDLGDDLDDFDDLGGDLEQLFPDLKFPTAEELKAKEDSFSIGDRVKVSDNIRCRQKGKIGTIVRIDPEDKHNWKTFIVKFDDEKYGAMGFHSGDIDKISESESDESEERGDDMESMFMDGGDLSDDENNDEVESSLEDAVDKVNFSRKYGRR